MTPQEQSLYEPNELYEEAVQSRIAILEAELADWQSGKRYMGGTGLQPGDLFHEHLVQLGATLGKTAGYSTVGSCDPIADVKALMDRIALYEACLEKADKVVILACPNQAIAEYEAARARAKS
jgi:glutathione S-transferase